MIRYLLGRAVASVVLVLAVVVLNFLLIRLAPGNPVQMLIGDYPAPPAYVQEVRHAFGLDRPVVEQLWLYLVNLARGNLGFSFANRQAVLPLLLARALNTLALMLPALVAATVLGLVLGVTAAYRARSVSDSIITSASVIGYSMPVFWLGQLLILLFAVQLRWLPVQGISSIRGSFTGMAAVIDFLRHLALPGFCVTVFYLAVITRVVRASVLDVIQLPFVVTAHSKGLSESRVRWRHVLPNALIPIVTVVAYNFGYVFTGAILTETVFGWPGIGNLFYGSIANRDYPVLEGVFLLSGVAVVVVNLLTDLLYVVLDPRIRLTRSAYE